MVRTIRADERSLLIKHTVQYILNQSAKKLSFKRADIVKNCLHEEQPLFDEIFPAVDEQLEEVNFYYHDKMFLIKKLIYFVLSFRCTV